MRNRILLHVEELEQRIAPGSSPVLTNSAKTANPEGTANPERSAVPEGPNTAGH